MQIDSIDSRMVFALVGITGDVIESRSESDSLNRYISRSSTLAIIWLLLLSFPQNIQVLELVYLTSKRHILHQTHLSIDEVIDHSDLERDI